MNHGSAVIGIILERMEGIGLIRGPMSSLPIADLLALDTDGIKSRLSKLRRYL
jgi:hypothetical protein